MAETDRADKIIRQAIRTSEPDNELYSLASRIFKREITPVISHSLLHSSPSQGLRVFPQFSCNALVVIDLDCRNEYLLIYLSQ